MAPLRIATSIVIAAGVLLVAPAAQADLPPSCVSFTDTPLVAGSTVIKAAHLTELRACINDLRAQKSLGSPSWTDPVIVPQQTPVKAAHVAEMRTALNEVYSAGGQQPPSYSAAPIAGVTTIAATHFNEIRSAAQNAPPGPCNLDLTPDAYPGIAPAAGGTGNFTLAAPCSWHATSSAPWLTVTPTSGSGNQTLQFTFAENTSAPRSAYVDVGGLHFDVTQGGVGTTTELIYNGDFELGFQDINDPMGTGRLANGWILAGNPENPARLTEAGIPGDKEQWVDTSGGIRQFVTMPPGVEYLLTADMYVHGTVGLYMQQVPGGAIQQVLNVRQGAQRVRLPITHSATYAPGNVLVSILTATGETVRIDHVSLRPTAEVIAEEIVQNANFENGFHEFGDTNGSGLVGNSWTHSGQSTPPQGLFGAGGPNSNFWQNVDGGSFGTGVHQTVTLLANQKYLVHANVKMDSGGVKLVIGPTGGVESGQVYICGGHSTWHELQTIFTPGFTGQYTVAVKSLFAQSGYSVDDISITPTTLSGVQPSSAGPGTPCIQMHNLTFEVHDSVTQLPVPEATVEISPDYGSGPPRFTYPDGTISYLVGDDPLQFTVTKNGYVTHTRFINTTGVGTWAVSLAAQGSSGPSEIEIVEPPANSTYPIGAVIQVRAATDSPGQSISRVDFFADGVLVGTDATPPFETALSGLFLGTHHLTAQAFVGSTPIATAPNVSVNVGNGSCQGAPLPNPNDDIPDDYALNCLIAAGGTVTLTWGYPGYIVATGLVLSSNGVRIQGDGGQRPFLIADEWLDAPMLRVVDGTAGYWIQDVIFNGNRINRQLYTVCDANNYPLRTHGYNLLLRGSGFTVTNIYSVGALCGSAMEVFGSGFTISDNHILANGYQQGEGLTLDVWSDGITLLNCDDGQVYGNHLEDNTDVDLIVGQGLNCQVHDNQIVHNNRYAFAGLMIGFSGDHSGSVVTENYVTSGLNLLAIGLMVGQHPWNTKNLDGTSTTLTDAGEVSGNHISGAVTLMWIDGISQGIVMNNDLSLRQGTRSLFGCAHYPFYAAADYGIAQVQTGASNIQFNDTVCQPFNP